jgi:2-dehydro-3-deoxyglucarate aldolase/4-hydroxy-2-oxoheptanedioate aldolase
MDRTTLTDPVQQALGVIQIETLAALDAADEIAAQDGVDVLFVGPLDLSFALGVPLQFDRPRFTDALDRVLSAASRHGKAAGILAANAALAARYVERGFRFVAIGSDSTMLAAALSDAFTAARTTGT